MKKMDLTGSRMNKKIAIIAPGYGWLPGESGTSRFSYMAGYLTQNGYDVDLIGSTFQHFKKARRDIERLKAMVLPYHLVFVDEPGYRKNIDIRRIYSNYILSRNTLRYLKNHADRYDLIYCVIPPNILSAKVAGFCRRHRIPFIVDIEDLWPEAMKMVVKIPFLSNLIFFPYWKDAERTYRLADGVIGTSDEYTMRAFKNQKKDIPYATIYVGTEMDVFDEGVRKYGRKFEKPREDFRVTYAGSIGTSYDIKTLIDAAKLILLQKEANIRFYILGAGPLKEELEQYAAETACDNVVFMGYMEYQKMAAFLSKSDILVNSYIRNAPQSVVTKIGDYLAAGKPIINTLANPEFCRMVEQYGFGINVEAENADRLASTILGLYHDAPLRAKMSLNARRCAEEKFDREKAYGTIVEIIRELTE